MTRDNELIRQIILAIKARKDATPQALEVDGADQAIVARHLEMLLDLGLLEGEKLRAFNAAPYPTILVKDLTWSGHDLAAVMENETVLGPVQAKAFAVRAYPDTVARAEKRRHQPSNHVAQITILIRFEPGPAVSNAEIQPHDDACARLSTLMSCVAFHWPPARAPWRCGAKSAASTCPAAK